MRLGVACDYRGTVPGLTDVASGNVSMEFTDLAPALPLIHAGSLKILAVLSSQRNPEMPHVPSIAETVQGYDAMGWQGFFARAGTPKTIVDKLNATLVSDLKAAGNRGSIQGDRHRRAMGHPATIPRLCRCGKRKMGQGHPRCRH